MAARRASTFPLNTHIQSHTFDHTLTTKQCTPGIRYLHTILVSHKPPTVPAEKQQAPWTHENTGPRQVEQLEAVYKGAQYE